MENEKPITTTELIKMLKTYKINYKRCPYCLNILSKTNNNLYYCSNEMCLNENQYTV